MGFWRGDRVAPSADRRRRKTVRLFPDGHPSGDRGRRCQQARAARRGGASAGVAAVYNAYARVGGDPAFAGRLGDYQALLRPLFMLSFLVDAALAEHQFFGATSVLLSSASSKTAIGLAHLLHTQRRPVRVIGLTSTANVDFVASLGCYDEVVTYENIETLPGTVPTALIDFAGSADLRHRVHRRYGDKLVHSARIGLTHQDLAGEDVDLPGAPPTWFFAPDQIRLRARQWGPGGIEQRLSAAWSGFSPHLERWIEVIQSQGPAAVEQVYRETLGGRASPRHGHMLSLD